MRTGETGINLIKKFESLRLEAYRCPGGVWTIGYGHTKGVKKGMVITEKEADVLLKQDLEATEEIINRECPGINQNQFDALMSFVFNVGEGNFKKSTLLKCIKTNPENVNIRYEFSRWNKSKGMILSGLIRRRGAEADLYFS